MTSGRVVLAGEPGVGIVVSDGRAVARCDDDGRFVLDGDGALVWVVRPAGSDAPAWYLPAGEDLVFALEPVAAPSSFVHVTDLHLSLGDPSFDAGAGDATFWLGDGGLRERIVTTPRVLAALLDELAGAEPGALVIATGDLTNSGAEAEFEALRAVLARAPVRVVAMPGNHDLMPGDPSELGDGGHNFTAVTARYERWLGPRWFSFDLPGLHVVAIDWFTHRLGIDPEQQEAWIAADLSHTDLPYILLSHDQMGADFFDRLPRAPLASFSGHWHTSRVTEHAGVLHVNTGTTTFGGLDYSPAHYRSVRWDGGIRVHTVARGTGALAGATFRASPIGGGEQAWVATLDGAAHLSPPVIAGDAVLVTSKREDEPGGALESFAIGDGSLRWRVRLGSAVKAAPLLVGERAVVTAVTGETVCVDAGTGAEHWRVMIDDPLRLWCYLRPVSDGERVFVGDVARYAALGLSDGAPVWTREDLGRRENLTSHAHPVVIGSTVVVSFPGQVPAMWGLDPATGRTRWPAGARGRSVYEGTQDEIVATVPRTPVSAMTADPEGRDLYVVRLGSRIERVSAADGAIVWSSPMLGWFNPARPVVLGETIVACSAMGEVSCFERAGGAVRWRASVAEDAVLAVGPYRDRGPALLAGPAVAGDDLVVATGDGGLLGMRGSDGATLGRAELPVPVYARPAVAAGLAIVAGVDGSLRAVPLARVGIHDWSASSLYV